MKAKLKRLKERVRRLEEKIRHLHLIPGPPGPPGPQGLTGPARIDKIVDKNG